MLFPLHRQQLIFKRKIVAVLFLALVWLSAPVQAGDQYQVLRVVDGDTMVIDYWGGPKRSGFYAWTPRKASTQMPSRTYRWAR